jgi:GntR family transcriptional regulator/MocR family aminotransferase
MRIDEARWLRLEPRPGETLRAAAERMLREGICSGALRPGVRLPSSRALAAQLGVSRGVTSEAYGQLAAQGFLVVNPKSAPVVASVASPPPPASPRRELPPTPRFDLTPTTPDVALFPRSRWLSAFSEVMRSAPLAAFDYSEPRGERELREALADQLGRTRGVVASPEQIVVVNGAAQGIDLLARLLAGRGARRVAVEDPSLDSQPQRLRINGLEPVAQPVDRNGLVVAGLDADAVIVTPAHQFPTGAVLSGSRRRELLEWSRQRDALVIEDDYDAEFRYDREPIRALQGLDRTRVAYLGTTSKTLAPALRLAWTVVPEHLADEAEEVKHLLDVSSPPIEQRTLARLIRSGEYDRHIRRARTAYGRRRTALSAALRRHLPDLPVEGVAAGLHVLIRLPPGIDDEAVAVRAEARGVRVVPLSRYTHSAQASGGLVIGYGRTHEASIPPAIRILAGALEAEPVSTAAKPQRSRQSFTAPSPSDTARGARITSRQTA